MQNIKRRVLHFKMQQSKALNTKLQRSLEKKAGTIHWNRVDSLMPSKDRLLSCFASCHLCVAFIPRLMSGQEQSQLSHFDARAIQRRRNRASWLVSLLVRKLFSYSPYRTPFLAHRPEMRLMLIFILPVSRHDLVS